jgi:hypothetical protein
LGDYLKSTLQLAEGNENTGDLAFLALCARAKLDVHQGASGRRR